MYPMRKTLAMGLVCLMLLWIVATPLEGAWTAAVAGDATEAASAPAATPTPADDQAAEEVIDEAIDEVTDEVIDEELAAGDFAMVDLKTGTVNLRKSAANKGIVLAKMPHDSLVEVVDINGDWAKVIFRGKTGYVKAAFLKKAAPITDSSGESWNIGEPVELDAGGWAAVNLPSGTVNLRKTRSDKGGVLAKLPRDTFLEVLESDLEWTKVAFRDKTGYVRTVFLRKSDPPPEPTPVPTPEPIWGEDDDENETDDLAAISVRFAKVLVKSGTVNLRKVASDTAKVIARLPQDSRVLILDRRGEWTKASFNGKRGYVRTMFLEDIAEIPFALLKPGDKGDAVIALKRQMRKLSYLPSSQINNRFDDAMVQALTKLQLMNGLTPTGEATPELQALVMWGTLVDSKSGYLSTATDAGSGLRVSIFCWDSGSRLYEEDQAVSIQLCFAAQAAGGQPPYTITVKKSLSSRDGESTGEEVTSPFPYLWKPGSAWLYLYATATDANGDSATARVRFRYALPARYQGQGTEQGPAPAEPQIDFGDAVD
jgi:SH3-like domain-containing protein/peptidoglycan hydrolase-like protein with peptidoglycan-binding domain